MKLIMSILILLVSTTQLAVSMDSVKRPPIRHFMVKVCDREGCLMKTRPHWVIKDQDGSVRYVKAYR